MNKNTFLFTLFLLSTLCASQDTLLCDTLSWIPIVESAVQGAYEKAPQSISADSINAYKRDVSTLFPKDFPLEENTFQLFKRELRRVKESTEKTYTLFETFHDNLAYNYESPDSLLESRFVRQWVRAAMRERSPMVRHAYALFFPDRFTFGNNMIDACAFDGTILVNANPYYRKSGRGKGDTLYRPDTITSLLTVDKMVFRSPFRGGRFKRVYRDTLVATRDSFQFKHEIGDVGMYRVSLHNDDYYNEHYHFRSRLKLVVKSDPEHLYLFAHDTEDARSGAFHYRMRFGDTLLQGVSDSTGVLKFPYTVVDTMRAHCIVERDGSYAFWSGILGQKDPVVDSTYLFIATDRTVYRPGDKVHCYGIVRQLINETSLQRPAVDSLHFAVDSVQVTTAVDSAGWFSFEYQVPLTQKTTTRTCTIRVSDTLTALSTRGRSHSIRIQKFAEREISIQAAADRNYYNPGDTITVVVDIESPDLKSTTGGRLTVSAPDRSGRRQTILDSLLLPGGFVHWRGRVICFDRHETSVDIRFETANRDYYTKSVKVNRSFPRTVKKNSSQRSGFTFDRNEYSLGDTAQVTFHSRRHARSFPFYVEGNEISFFARGDRAHRTFALLPLAEEYGFNRHLSANSRRAATLPIDLISSLSSTVLVKSKIENSWASVELSLYNPQGEPIAGVLRVSVVDEDLYNENDDSSDMRAMITGSYGRINSFPNRVQRLYGKRGEESYSYFFDLFTTVNLGMSEVFSKRQTAVRHSFYQRLKSRWESSDHMCPYDHSGVGFSGGSGTGIARWTKGLVEKRVGRVPLRLRPDGNDCIYFNDALSTDSQGKTTLRFLLPQRSGRWRVTILGSDSQGNLIHKRHWIEN